MFLALFQSWGRRLTAFLLLHWLFVALDKPLTIICVGSVTTISHGGELHLGAQILLSPSRRWLQVWALLHF